ncbi:MAG TPA: DinB family protein [Ilumatobacteraceae bacterium]|nr:DinB family protein [Ilumatobacteraceae bacterium]
MDDVATGVNLSAVILEGLDNAWNPLLERLAGIADDEYMWEPTTSCWTVREDAEGRTVADWADPDPVPAPVTTIAWRCWHIAVDCLDSYSSRLFGATGTGLSGLEWVHTANEAQSMLAAAWDVFRAGVVDWGDDGVWKLLGPAWGPYAERTNLALAIHAQREVIHHGAEIALLRDLYRARS